MNIETIAKVKATSKSMIAEIINNGLSINYSGLQTTNLHPPHRVQSMIECYQQLEIKVEELRLLNKQKELKIAQLPGEHEFQILEFKIKDLQKDSIERRGYLDKLTSFHPIHQFEQFITYSEDEDKRRLYRNLIAEVNSMKNKIEKKNKIVSQLDDMLKAENDEIIRSNEEIQSRNLLEIDCQQITDQIAIIQEKIRCLTQPLPIKKREKSRKQSVHEFSNNVKIENLITNSKDLLEQQRRYVDNFEKLKAQKDEYQIALNSIGKDLDQIRGENIRLEEILLDNAPLKSLRYQELRTNELLRGRLQRLKAKVEEPTITSISIRNAGDLNLDRSIPGDRETSRALLSCFSKV